jgi:hypothetical protein
MPFMSCFVTIISVIIPGPLCVMKEISLFSLSKVAMELFLDLRIYIQYHLHVHK